MRSSVLLIITIFVALNGWILKLTDEDVEKIVSYQITKDLQFEQPHIQGHCDDKYKKLKEAFEYNFKHQNEVGASVAAYVDGKKVVDLWGGYRNAETKTKWEEDTLQLAFSNGKSVCSLCIAVLVDRGILDYNTPVAHYWPDFAKNGKENITLKQLLTHQAGLSALDEAVTIEDLKNPIRIKQLFADQKPLWLPPKSGYHALTFGELLSSLIHEVTKGEYTCGKFFRKEIAEKIGIDYYIGFPEELEPRLGTVYAAPFIHAVLKLPRSFVCKMLPFVCELGIIENPADSALLLDITSVYSLAYRSLMYSPVNYNAADLSKYNDRAIREVEFPSASGIGNARALAKLYAALSMGGELDGVRIIGEKTLDYATQVEITGVDELMKFPMNKTRGGFLHFGNPEPSFGGAGMGGSLSIASKFNVTEIDPNTGKATIVTKRVSFSYVMNRLCPNFRSERLYRLLAAFFGSFENRI
eukprot:TRINITY_DN1082_c2_g1_i1.p1 TRINITY_DN1082_c2_g1~~TRINITY_DN1082_c2_g1_i1.p1  ORF type:complete len:470 (-),score=197.97 TRINITY_DN1082_c2_g1_i1:101-1510(-)